MTFLISVLAFLFIAIRLIFRKNSNNLNHRKQFNLKSYKKSSTDNESIHKNWR